MQLVGGEPRWGTLAICYEPALADASPLDRGSPGTKSPLTTSVAQFDRQRPGVGFVLREDQCRDRDCDIARMGFHLGYPQEQYREPCGSSVFFRILDGLWADQRRTTRREPRNPHVSYGLLLPLRVRRHDDRCVSDSRRPAATPKSAESGHNRQHAVALYNTGKRPIPFYREPL
jgi:hypothetical protein